MMHCPSCGTALEPGAAACAKCGAALPPALLSPASAAPLQRTQQSAASLLNYARGAKGIALLAFLLPMVTVSCGPQKLVSWSGMELASGRLSPPARVGGETVRIPFEPSADLVVIAAAALIVLGLVATVALPRPRAATAAIVAAVASAALLCFEFLVRLPQALYQAILDNSGRRAGRTLGPGDEYGVKMLENAISVDPAIGFWLAIAGLAAAVVLCKMVLDRDRAAAGEGPS